MARIYPRSPQRLLADQMLRDGKRTADIARATGFVTSYVSLIRKRDGHPQSRQVNSNAALIEQMLRDGRPNSEISLVTGLTSSHISVLRRRGGFPRSPRSPRQRGGAGSRSEKRRLIRDALMEGGRSQAIADDLGVSISYVSHERRRMGLPPTYRRATPHPERAPRQPGPPRLGKRHGPRPPKTPRYSACRDEIVARLTRGEAPEAIVATMLVPLSYVQMAQREMFIQKQAATWRTQGTPPQNNPQPRLNETAARVVRAAVATAIQNGGYNADISRAFGVAPTYVSNIRQWVREGRLRSDGSLRPLLTPHNKPW